MDFIWDIIVNIISDKISFLLGVLLAHITSKKNVIIVARNLIDTLKKIDSSVQKNLLGTYKKNLILPS